MEDGVVTGQETTQIITSVFNSIVGGLAVAFMLLVVDRAIGGSNPNPGTTEEVIARAGLKEYEYRYFPEPEEERKPRVYPYTRRASVGAYEIVMTATDGACTIKLYEYLEGMRRKLRATWSGLSREECDAKFREVVGVVHQVRFEHMTALMR